MRTLSRILYIVLFSLALISCSENGPLSVDEITDRDISESSSLFEINSEDGVKTVNLLAGQFENVGEVSVITKGDTEICVTYSLSESALADGWRIYETHLAIGDDLEDIPTKGPGNPAPGQFPYGDDTLDGVEEWTICVSFEELEGSWGMYFGYDIYCDPCEPASIIYGITGTGGVGGLYAIEIEGNSFGSETLLYEYDISPGDNFSGNGLAYDGANNRLYFATGSGSSGWTLYFYDFATTEVVAASELPGPIYSATWGAGMYWFTPNDTDDMYTVSFDSDGINGNVVLFDDDFAGDKSFRFGDLAFDTDSGIIYGSTSFSGSDYEFFKYTPDLINNTGVYEMITDTGDARGLQLAIAGDGNLYGHITSESGWVLTNRNDGTTSPLGNGVHSYNDLSNGPSVVCPD